MAAKKDARAKQSVNRKVDSEIFGLPKTVKKKIRECVEEEQKNKAPQVVFLWACVNETGLRQGVKKEKQDVAPLSKEAWLTVVDEAASLGANWLVLSFGAALADCENIWDVCVWAQDAHNMMVGLHIKTPRLSRKDINAVKKLNLVKTRILARSGALSRVTLSDEEKKQIVVWTANPQPDGERPNCQGPTRMIFVNAQGVLYTCGLVEGNDAYRLGTVFDARLKTIISSPELPHHVQEELHYVTPECDGCPALIANYFSENM